MELIRTIATMQSAADSARSEGRRLCLVPTMGALHDGHLALVHEAKRQADHVTVSVFVNPTQFAPGEDFEVYPRTLEADVEALEAIGGVDVVFAPTTDEMYPFGIPAYTTVRVRRLDQHLCGAFREGHFEGVTSVVAKLFLACRPDVAVFGQKDAQQLAIVRRMTAELGFEIEIIGHPIVREEDGLAMSSRNLYLTTEQRAQAVVLSQALGKIRRMVEGGERSAEAFAQVLRDTVAGAPLARLQYAEIVDAKTLQPVEVLESGCYLAALAVFFGPTRLIDNATLEMGE